jgi:hypothetical protein
MANNMAIRKQSRSRLISLPRLSSTAPRSAVVPTVSDPPAMDSPVCAAVRLGQCPSLSSMEGMLGLLGCLLIVCQVDEVCFMPLRYVSLKVQNPVGYLSRIRWQGTFPHEPPLGGVSTPRGPDAIPDGMADKPSVQATRSWTCRAHAHVLE